MRKGTIFIFTGVYPSDYYLDYLARELLPNVSKQIVKSHRLVKINGYKIQIMKYPNERLRGYRPEFIYYIGDGNIINYNENNVRTEGDTKILSTRKEPIRCIDEAEEIDLREFIDDDYSLLQCRFKKLEWKDRFKYIWLQIRNKIRKGMKKETEILLKL